MADKDLGNQDGPSLELPSFGFRRRKKDKKPAEAVEEVVEPAPQSSAAAAKAVPEPASAPEAADDEPTVVLPDPAPTAGIPGASTAATAATRDAPVAHEAPAAHQARVAPDVPTAREALVNRDAPTAATPHTPTGTEIDAAEAPDLDDPDDETADPDPTLLDRFEPLMRFPELAGRWAAAVTGGVIGILAVGATFAALRLCGVIKGTTSCGGPGLILLIAILVILVYVGSFLLKGFRQPDSFSTSFLAVGLLSVVALLFLVDVLFSWAMIIVIPLVGAGTYLLSHWVTTSFIEPAREEHEFIDR